MSRLYLTRRAELDLIAIEDFSIRTWGKQVAGAYLDAFQTVFDLLQASPGLLRSRAGFREWLLFYRVERHWLVCAMLDEDIYVLTVRHGAMDLPERLSELEPQFEQEAEILYERVLMERAH